MNRRAFFGVLAAGLVAAADPERLLWVPGRKLISIPKPPPSSGIDYSLGPPLTIVEFWYKRDGVVYRREVGGIALPTPWSEIPFVGRGHTFARMETDISVLPWHTTIQT